MSTTQRIQCPRCRANNFPGQPRCFQCGNGLPPPESVESSFVSSAGADFRTSIKGCGLGLPSTEAPGSMAQTIPTDWKASAPNGGVQGSRKSPLAVAVTAAAIVILVVLGAGLISRNRAVSQSSGDPSLRAAVEQLRKMQGTEPVNRDSSEDPQVSDAKRTIDRLRRENGIEPPPGADGKVSLRIGGQVTQEQYQKALDALGRAKVR